jgi:hypothetical protein
MLFNNVNLLWNTSSSTATSDNWCATWPSAVSAFTRDDTVRPNELGKRSRWTNHCRSPQLQHPKVTSSQECFESTTLQGQSKFEELQDMVHSVDMH